MGYYSFNRPRRDGRLSWPCWLTDSGRLTHKVVTRPAISLAQDRESSPAVTGVLTTMLRHQLNGTSPSLLKSPWCILLSLQLKRQLRARTGQTDRPADGRARRIMRPTGRPRNSMICMTVVAMNSGIFINDCGQCFTLACYWNGHLHVVRINCCSHDMARRSRRMADSWDLRLNGWYSDGLRRHHGGDTSNVAPYYTVDVAVHGKHGDERHQDADEEVEIDHESHINNSHKRTRWSVDELHWFSCRTNMCATDTDFYRAMHVVQSAVLLYRKSSVRLSVHLKLWGTVGI